MAAKVTKVIVNQEPIELYKILKMENLFESGAAAKHAIAEGLVQLNGLVEVQKRKKIYDGDRISLDGIQLQVKVILRSVSFL
jgi:ribosome-associated protein